MKETSNTDTKVRKDYKDCPPQRLADFIGQIEMHGAFSRKSYVAVSDVSHFERFNYAAGKDNISIVYDTKAGRLSVTAKQELTDALNDLFCGKPCSITVPAAKLRISEKLRQKKNGGDAAGNPVKKKKSDSEPDKQISALPPLNALAPIKNKRQFPKICFSPAPESMAPPQNFPKNRDNKRAENPVSFFPPSEIPEYKNGFSLKNITREKFESFLLRVRALKGVYTKSYAEFTGKPSELVTVEATGPEKQKAYLRFMPGKASLSLQGKRSGLYAEVQMILSSGAESDAAVSSPAVREGEDQKATAAEKKLKKLIPSAFEYLSVQSKIDFTIGLSDIYSDTIQLSDYSVLLVPPYRGLERLIYDLQAAEGITVKMIGQGFEKRQDGTYCLKSGYRKRIDSIVYNEVMAALYTEYFTERHFLTHSDNTDAVVSRGIRDIEEARKKYNNLLSLIEYNCKKLKEIGFSLDKKPEIKS